ncbi:MAG: hypothetical protein B6244_08000 [Candidatus Cloacimonetes bacterium 4572_55]|nr:MAG: hypothetical protein B6244_08000 [Candidatus Cloacimonetes bacterium 4572_55]
MNYLKPEQTYVALLHYPVYNKHGEVITSAVTNLDIHDIARVVQTYGLGGYYLATPVKNQYRLLAETLEFWQKGTGKEYNPTRSRSFDQTKVVSSVAAVRKELGKNSLWVATTAKKRPNCITLDDVRDWGERHPDRNTVFLFGTGYGLTDEFISSYEHILCPIEGGTLYNHLSVRSAATIIIDRLFGR